MELAVSNKTDKQVSLFIVLQVTLMGVKNVLVQGVPFLYDINEKLNILITSVVSILYLYALLKVGGRRTSGSAKLFAVFIASSIIFTLLVFPQNEPFMQSSYLRWIVVFFLTAYLICKLTSLEWLQHYMLMGSYFMTLSGVLYAFEVQLIGHSVTSDWSTYSMSMSNVVMWAVMWQLHAYFKNNSFWSLAFALVGIAVIFLYGSRNPLLAIFIYGLILLYDRSKSKKYSSSFMPLLLVGLLMVGLVLNVKPILNGLSSFLEGHGLSSRSLTLLLGADTEDFSTGRNDIHNEIRKLIWDNPIVGSGVCGDEANIGEMAHSLYLSVFVTYGVIIGSLFLLAVAVMCIKALKKARGMEHQILVMYLCLVLPRGFTGGDMWGSDVFWWLMGIVFMILSNKQRIRRNAVSYIRQESVSVG